MIRDSLIAMPRYWKYLGNRKRAARETPRQIAICTRLENELRRLWRAYVYENVIIYLKYLFVGYE